MHACRFVCRASHVAQWQRNYLPMQKTQKTWVQSLGPEIPWRMKWQPTPVSLPGKSHGQRNLVGYSPRGRKSQTQLEQLSKHSIFSTFLLPGVSTLPWGIFLWIWWTTYTVLSTLTIGKFHKYPGTLLWVFYPLVISSRVPKQWPLANHFGLEFTLRGDHVKPPKELLFVALTEVSSIYYIFSGPLIEKPTGEISLPGKWGQQNKCFAFHEHIVYFYLKGTTTFLNDRIPLFTLAMTKLKAKFTTQIWQLNCIVGQAFHRRFLCTKPHLTLSRCFIQLLWKTWEMAITITGKGKG